MRFLPSYMDQYKMAGMPVRWDAFADSGFTEPLDAKAFGHNDRITREGWAKYYFDGIFPKDRAYLRLQIFERSSNLLVKTFYFLFVKGYRTSLDGRFYMKDPVLEEKIVKGGTMYELLPTPVKQADGTVKTVYKKGSTTIREEKVRDIVGEKVPVTKDVSVIRQMSVRYVEKPKAVFLVTPPHLIDFFYLYVL